MVLDKRVEKLNVFYLGLIILWPVIKQVFLNIDGANRLETIFSVIVIIENGKVFVKCPKAMYFWMAWIVYNLINTHFKGFYIEGYPYSVWAPYRLFVPLAVMLISYQTALYGRIDLYRKLFYFFFIYVLLGAVGLSSVEAHDVGTRVHNDMGNHYFNTLILSATYAAICFYKKNVSLSLCYCLLIFSFIIIIFSGERKGLLGLLTILFGFLYAKNAGKGLKSILAMIVLFIVGYISISYLMQFTTAGIRMSNAMVDTDYNDNLFLMLMGDRAVMYVEGWDSFMHNFWTGIGLMNGAREIIGLKIMFHTEYMMQMAECGMIGFALFLGFYISMIRRCTKMLLIPSERETNCIIIFTLMAIILINFVAWSFDNTFYFMFFGILFAHGDKLQNRCLKRIKK